MKRDLAPNTGPPIDDLCGFVLAAQPESSIPNGSGKVGFKVQAFRIWGLDV